MNREFLINVLFLITVNILIKPFFVFGIDMKVQNIVGGDAFGLYFSLFNFSYMLQIFNDLGIQYYNNRNIAQYPHLLSKYFWSILSLKTILAFLCIILAVLAAKILGYKGFEWHLLSFLILNQIILSLIFYLRSNISGLQYYRWDSILSIADKILMILFCSILLWGKPFGEVFKIEWYIYAQTLSYFITCLVAFAILVPHIGKMRFHWNLPLFLVIIKKSYPYALAVFLMTIYLRSDGVMIERLLPESLRKTESGAYASAYRILDAVNTLGLLFAGLLMPMFARLLKTADKEAIHSLLGFSFRSLMVVTIAVSVGVCFYRNEIVHLLLEDSTDYTGLVLGVFIFCFNCSAVIYTFGSLLTVNRSLRAMNTFFSIGVLLNILLNFLVIPTHKALGSAVVTLITQSLIALSQILLCYYLLKIHLGWAYWFKILLYAFITVLFFAGSRYFLPVGTVWYFGFLGAGSLCAILAFIIKMLDIHELKILFKSKGI